MKYTPEQTKDNRRKWEEALLSGKYEQHTHGLISWDGTGYCCLGVACEISGLGKWDRVSYVTKHHAHGSVLPGDVRDWLGLMDKSGSFRDVDGRHKSLIDLNDNGSSFAEIAETIAAEPPGLIAI